MPNAPALLPIGPMARRLHVTVAWLRAEAEANRVPCLRAGQAFLFSPEAVEQALVERAKWDVDSPNGSIRSVSGDARQGIAACNCPDKETSDVGR